MEEIEAAVAQAQTAIDALSTKADIVAAAKAVVEGYKTDVEYFDEQAAEKATVVATALETIEAAASEEAVNSAVEAAKAAIDEIKTKAEVEADILNAQKAAANATVDALKKAIDFDLYEEDAITTINGLYSTVKAAITAATTEAEINSAVAAFEAALAEVPQKDNGDVEEPTTSEDPTTSEEPTTSEDPATSDSSNLDIKEMLGCSSGINAITFGVMALGLGVMKLLKKKED